MDITRKKLAVVLGWFAALLLFPHSRAQTEDERAKLDRFLKELHPTLPWYYGFIQHPTIRFDIPNLLYEREINKDRELWHLLMGAKAKLSAMGTNAWPAVPILLKDVGNTNKFETAVLAAEILAEIKADEHPDWPILRTQLRDQAGPVWAFQNLLSKKQLIAPPDEEIHHRIRRFGLIGLAAVGPMAAAAVPATETVLRNKDDHELWVHAMIALKEIRGDLTTPTRFLISVAQDTEEWPRFRASAIKTLAASLPDAPETRRILQQSLRDEKSRVRLAAAQELWRLNGKPDDLLSTLATLLQSRLASVRIAALTTISEIGNAAQPIRSDVEQLSRDEKESVRQAATKTLDEIRSR